MSLASMFLHTNTVEKQLFWVFAVLAIAGVFCYGYFVHATIVATAERINITSDVQELNAEIGEREAAYSDLKSHLTYETAQALGFTAPQARLYAVQTRLVKNTQ